MASNKSAEMQDFLIEQINTGLGKGGVIEKTIGPNGDFINFKEAQEWYDSLLNKASVHVYLTIEDGVHNFTVKQDGYLFSVKDGGQVTIQGSGQGNVEVNIVGETGTETAYNIFNFKTNVYVKINGITFKGDETVDFVFFIKSAYNSTIMIYSTDIYNFKAGLIGEVDVTGFLYNFKVYNPTTSGRSQIILSYNCHMHLYGNIGVESDSLNNIDGYYAAFNSEIIIDRATLSFLNMRYPLQSYYGSKILFYDTTATFENIVLALSVKSTGDFLFGDINLNGTIPTYTNVTTVADIPLNEIQYDTSLICDGINPIVNKI